MRRYIILRALENRVVCGQIPPCYSPAPTLIIAWTTRSHLLTNTHFTLEPIPALLEERLQILVTIRVPHDAPLGDG